MIKTRSTEFSGKDPHNPKIPVLWIDGGWEAKIKGK
jgi:hypothetical protein